VIIPLQGDDLGVVKTKKHVLMQWTDGIHRVVCSATRHGDALSCHFAASKDSLRYIKQAINEFTPWAFNVCPWCKMIIANIKRQSVKRVVEKCGFELFAYFDENSLYFKGR